MGISKRYASEEYVNNAIDEIVFPDQVKSDWNQNNETSVDYIKNRPFYSTEPTDVILLENSITDVSDFYNQLTLDDGSIVKSAFLGEYGKVLFEENQNCTLVINDTSYTGISNSGDRSYFET